MKHPSCRQYRYTKTRLSVLGTVSVLVLLYGVNRFASARSLQMFGSIIDRVATSERVVALTFDDGPRREAVRALLPLLAAQHARATFFVEGRVIERDLTLAREIVAAGHELGNHSYSHKRMVLKSQRFIAEEIERTDQAIRAAGQVGTIYFRPPYGKKLIGLPRYLERHHRPTIMWDVEPDSGSSAEQIAAQVVRDTRPGAIILLHVMYASRRQTLDAIPAILHGLRARGYRFASMSELLLHRPDQPTVRSKTPI
jgi:peptidoglycan/xylan/chitin deacetylase (PgdA/CDA1 family)